MKIVVVDSSISFCPSAILDDFELDNDVPSNYSLKIFGKSLIMRNINILNSLYNIDKIIIPKKLGFLKTIINDNYPFNVVLEEFEHRNYNKILNAAMINKTNNNSYLNLKSGNETIYSGYSSQIQNVLHSNKSSIYLPCNVILGKNSSKNHIDYSLFRFPWEFLDSVTEVLQNEVKDVIISDKSKIAKSSIIEGPCVIEDNVVIDDFVKIKGPVFIGEGSFIGMGSLIRNSILEYKTNIGFNCEVAKTYFAGNAKISHHNVILDSIIGKNVWFGGYSGTANVLLNRQNIRYGINGSLVDTGKTHFGAVVSNNCCIGAAVIILPGRRVPPNSTVPAGTIYQK